MIISSVTSIYFSPTGTTKKVINSITKGMGKVNNTIINLTNLNVRSNLNPVIDSDIVLIGVPVYEEKVPEMLSEFLINLKGNGKTVVLVAVYGNFGEGIALNELNTMAINSGFKVVAAASFIGEHSFSTKEAPVQEGRPDYYDLMTAESFGRNIIEKMKKLENIDDVRLYIPKGKLPLMAKVLPKNSARIFTKTPSADMNICNHCGACVKLCPMNAINKDTLNIDNEKCIRCFCCVKKCSKNARKIIYRPKFIVSKMLREKNKIKRTPQIFI
ncbi:MULTISPECIES: EFR1 family ferrodoxin [unclassified Clostridium]|uniref:EFR1 family ferrodoxin n=1 Tax=unclassified Clostridium TaxID=2614128 RepID=UPI000298274E|nr:MULTISPECIES: EFR1 family ferrodoxin [unclassified Clostridium]EKQ51492.1 MAG: dissimilatory sulfite reductase (desulfoviridin), alpha/beta subunit [Clostridium sp. Maddingley MBC34-26]